MHDFLNFKMYPVTIKAEAGNSDSGGYDITLKNDYSSGEVIITWPQLQEIYKKLDCYINRQNDYQFTQIGYKIGIYNGHIDVTKL